MKFLPILAAFFLAALPLQAQWTAETYELQPGWNAIYALNDASHTTLDLLLASTPAITQVWRWEPNNLSAQFIGDPTATVEGQEWKTWIRNDPANTTMSRLLPNFGYLVNVGGSSPVTLNITGRAILNRTTWSASGANLVGFPASTSPRPRFGGTNSGYFAPLAAIGYSPVTSNIYQYVGGEIGGSNPARVFNPTSSEIIRGKAYWVELPAYSDFVAPIDVELSSGTSMDFGTRSGSQKILVTNRSDAPVTVSVGPSPSESPPAGEPPILGEVPLLQRVFNASLQVFEFVPITGGLTADLAPGEAVSWTLAPDRAALSGPVGSLFATVLRVTDSGAHGSYADLAIPVTAEQGNLGGLWVGDAAITAVQNQLQRFQRDADGNNVTDADGNYILLDANQTITPAAQTFRLRLIVHVDAAGEAHLLSNVYFGALNTDPVSLGFATEQRFLLPAGLEDAARLTANHLPMDVNAVLSGTFTLGGGGSATIVLPHDDATNPFVHTYHPDHDNLGPRFTNPLPAGVESHEVRRAITLTIDATSPDGDPAWGTGVLTGTYAETLTGLHKNPIAVQGVFGLRRVSDSTVLQQ